MGAPIVVPFNFQPASVSVKTASYTIPSGRYALIHVECENGGAFTINGVTAVDTDPILNISVNANNASYTVPTGYRAEFRPVAQTNTGGALNLNGNSNYVNQSANSPNGTVPTSLGPGGTASVTSSGSGTTQGIHGVAIPGNATNRNADIWVPQGTVISGTGTWRATVMEFNMIS